MTNLRDGWWWAGLVVSMGLGCAPGMPYEDPCSCPGVDDDDGGEADDSGEADDDSGGADDDAGEADDDSGEADDDGAPVDVPTLLHMRPALWYEASAATTDYGLNRPVAFALDGTLDATQAINVRILHPWYAPFQDPMSEAEIRAWAQAALADPEVYGVALDHEGWTLAMGETILRALHEEAAAAGKFFCDVPKISLDHEISGTSGPEERVALLQQYTDCAAPWCYSCDAAAYGYYLQWWIGQGYTHPILPIGDGGWRPEYGGITQADALQTVAVLASYGISFGLFTPHYDDGTVLAAMAAAYP